MAKKPSKNMQILGVVGGVALMILAWRFPLPLGIAQPTTLLSAIAVLLGITIGPGRAALIAALYVVAVIFGLPPLIWGGSPGIEPFLALPLSGFSLGLIAAAITAGLLTPQGTDSGAPRLALAAILGHLAYLIIGIAWLTRFGPLAHAINAAIESQMIAVLAKSALVFGAAFGLSRVVRR